MNLSFNDSGKSNEISEEAKRMKDITKFAQAFNWASRKVASNELLKTKASAGNSRTVLQENLRNKR